MSDDTNRRRFGLITFDEGMTGTFDPAPATEKKFRYVASILLPDSAFGEKITQPGDKEYRVTLTFTQTAVFYITAANKDEAELICKARVGVGSRPNEMDLESIEVEEI